MWWPLNQGTAKSSLSMLVWQYLLVQLRLPSHMDFLLSRFLIYDYYINLKSYFKALFGHPEYIKTVKRWWNGYPDERRWSLRCVIFAMWSLFVPKLESKEIQYRAIICGVCYKIRSSSSFLSHGPTEGQLPVATIRRKWVTLECADYSRLITIVE